MKEFQKRKIRSLAPYFFPKKEKKFIDKPLTDTIE